MFELRIIPCCDPSNCWSVAVVQTFEDNDYHLRHPQVNETFSVRETINIGAYINRTEPDAG